jgi:hypothetical protein
LKTSGDRLAILTLVDIPDHGGVPFHLVVDVGLLFEQQRGGFLGALDLRLVNEARTDVAAGGVLAKIIK